MFVGYSDLWSQIYSTAKLLLMYLNLKVNARPNNNQLYTYYVSVTFTLAYLQYPVNTTYNSVLVDNNAIYNGLISLDK